MESAVLIDDEIFDSVMRLGVSVEMSILQPQGSTAQRDVKSSELLEEFRKSLYNIGVELGIGDLMEEVRLLAYALGTINKFQRCKHLTRYLATTCARPIVSLGERPYWDLGTTISGKGQNMHGRMLAGVRALQHGEHDLFAHLDNLYGADPDYSEEQSNNSIANALHWAQEVLTRDLPVLDLLTWTFARLSPGRMQRIIPSYDENDLTVMALKTALELQLPTESESQAVQLFNAYIRSDSPASPAKDVFSPIINLSSETRELEEGECSDSDMEIDESSHHTATDRDAVLAQTSQSQEPSSSSAALSRPLHTTTSPISLARYLVCQVQRLKAIGIIVNSEAFPEWPKYMALAVKADMSPCDGQSLFEIGEAYEVPSFTWNEAEGGKYQHLLEDEIEDGAFRKHLSREERDNLPAYAVFQETLNYQGIAVDPRRVHIPATADVLGRIIESKRGVLLVASNGIIRTSRVESWNIQGGECPNGDWLALKVNQMPNNTFVGTRYAFPPGEGWRPLDCLTADVVWMVASARIITNMSSVDPAWLLESKFAANNMMCIEEEMNRSKKFSIRAPLARHDDQSDRLSVELTRSASRETRDLMHGLLHRWKKDQRVDIHYNLSSVPLVSGYVVGSRLTVEDGQWTFASTIKPIDLNPATEENLDRAISDRTELLLRVPPQVEILQKMQHSMFLGELKNKSQGISPQATILRKVLGLTTQEASRCTLDHYHARDLNPEQTKVASLFNCHCTCGELIVVGAPFGTGKSTTARCMVRMLGQRDDVQIVVMCTTNKPLIEQAIKLAKELENYDIDMVLVLGKRAQRAYAPTMDQSFRDRHLISEDFDKKKKRHCFISNEEVIQKIKQRRPRVIMATCDKLVQISEVLSDTTHMSGDEMGRLPRLELAYLVSKAPKLRTLHITGDVKQFGVYDRDFSEHLKRENTGFDSSLKSLMHLHHHYSFRYSYRSHPALTAALSRAIYNREVLSGVDVHLRSILTSSSWFNLPVQDFPAALIQLSQVERRENWSTSVFNDEEIDVVLRIYQLIKRHMPNHSFLFVCSYELSKEKLLDEAARRGFRIDPARVKTVDEIIGDEGGIVFLLLTRTSSGNWDFLQLDERAVVSWTRMRDAIFVTGDFSRYSTYGVAERIVQEFNKETPIVAAADYLQLMTGPQERRDGVLTRPDNGRSIAVQRIGDLNRRWVSCH
jgi:hypothetical protein